ncbi:uracil-DNA glycosylase isoform X3 [Mustela putorius furo]|uniref:Uracil-DNA glycosylase isoform X3 n=1 Tax=Mustela putorius furo TaxID=9669 RepID=A0A8U0RXK0_MUSPF|nr:uracil-DNA glycosylase isoform X3 [Mustela putorius furo]
MNERVNSQAGAPKDPAYHLRLSSPTGSLSPQPLWHRRTRPSPPPVPPSPPRSEHARAVWRQFGIAAPGADGGFSERRAAALLGSGMIGQKTLYSFFSPTPAGKRRARSPEPADLGTGVAAVAEESGDAAVRRDGDRAPGARDGEEGDGPRLAEGLQGRATDSASPPKKARAGQEDPGTPPSSPLSPEQLIRIQRNKAAALLRLAARNVPVGFGESWKKPLSAEFGKPYFIKLMGFVAEERKHYTVYPPPHQVFTWTQMCDIRHFGEHL